MGVIPVERIASVRSNDPDNLRVVCVWGPPFPASMLPVIRICPVRLPMDSPFIACTDGSDWMWQALPIAQRTLITL